MSSLSMTRAEREAFLLEPHVGVLSVASAPDEHGRPPLTVPVWFAYQPGGHLTFFTGTNGSKTRKTRLLKEGGRLSFCVQRETWPYKFVTTEGTVVAITRAPPADQLVAIVRRYLPETDAVAFVDAQLAIPASESELTYFAIRPDRWLTADFSKV